MPLVDPVADRLADEVRPDRPDAEAARFEELAPRRRIPGVRDRLVDLEVVAPASASSSPSKRQALHFAASSSIGRSAHWPVKSVTGGHRAAPPSRSSSRFSSALRRSACSRATISKASAWVFQCQPLVLARDRPGVAAVDEHVDELLDRDDRLAAVVADVEELAVHVIDVREDFGPGPGSW